MLDNIVNKNLLSKKHRPFGVWILTIYALLFAGSNLLLSESFLVLKGEVAMFSSAQVPRMLLWAYLNIGIIIVSILTWAGWEPGRVFFLLLTTYLYLEQGMGIYVWIIHRDFGKAPVGNQIDSWVRFIGCIVIPVLYIWYFSKLSTRKFDKGQERYL